MKKVLIITCLICLASCKKEDEPQLNNMFEVTSAGNDFDCGLIAIDFKEKDKERIEKIASTSGWLRYYALNLDDNFSQVSQVIIVTVRRTRDDEYFACTHKWPSYPWITVLTAEKKE